MPPPLLMVVYVKYLRAVSNVSGLVSKTESGKSFAGALSERGIRI